MKICSNHSEYKVPLIQTMAFDGAEYWCPFCGYTGPFLGAGRNVPESELLINMLSWYKTKSTAFLRASSRRVAYRVQFEGMRMAPKDLPQSEKDRDTQAIKNWKYGQIVS